ncbi:MAG: ATP-binding protein, partial [Bacillota bacterium]|nr:ATP-binding protein [Bacillota bacterium]
MSPTKGRVSFYGIEGIEGKLDTIIKELNIEQQYFEIKLIMMEAVTNAFIHGNNLDTSKLIMLHYELINNLLLIEVTDCGNGFKNIIIPEQINENDILKESGRGIYLINCYADEVK